jgi:uncharacterized protein YgbK (DUF1537 family)
MMDMTRSLHLIADDLTGAADTGVVFVRSGRSVTLFLQAGQAGRRSPGHGTSEITVVDTDTRESSPDLAGRVIAAVANEIASGRAVFKKIDSLLRGNIAQEVAALRTALPDRLVLVAPALPALGRHTRGGVQHAEGLPVHESGTWTGEAVPAPRRVDDLIPGTILRLEAIRGDPDTLIDTLTGIADERQAALCDAEADEDLRALVRAAVATGRDVLWVGTAGLASALAIEWAIEWATETPADAGDVPPASSPQRSERYVAILGSIAPVARQQAFALSQAGAAWADLPVDVLVGSPTTLADRVATMGADGDLVVTVSGDIQPRQRDAVARGLALATAGVAAHAPRLFVSGGATARAVLTHRGVTQLELIGELEPGVVISVPDDDASTYVITKAGTFGNSHSLVRVLGATMKREATA